MSGTNSKNRFIILAMALGLLMSSLDHTITSAAINHILGEIGGFESMSWVFTSYVLASTSTMLIFGKLSDLFGRKLFYLIGISVFLLGSALCGIAQTMEQLIFFRAIQGIGSGALFPITFSILFTLSSDPRYTGRISGVFAGIYGLSSVAGPQLGTFISNFLGWRWCFYVNLPIGVVAFLTLFIALQESRSMLRPKIDYPGTFSLVIATVSLMLALEWGGKQYLWSSWAILTLVALAVAASITFIFCEKKASEPILPLFLFRNRMVVATSIACLVQGAIMFAAVTYMPIFSVAVLGHSNSNGVLTPMMLSLVAGAALFGRLQTKLSFRSLMAFSMLAGIGSTAALSHLSFQISYLNLSLLMILLGFAAIGPLMSIAQNAIAYSVDKKYIGISSSLVGFCRNMGGVIGVSITAAVVNRDYQNSIAAVAESNQIPSDQLKSLYNPEILMNSAIHLDAHTQGLLRESLGTSIQHGYIVGIGFAVIGFLAVLQSGEGKKEVPEKDVDS